MSRCTGHCCENFFIPISKSKIESLRELSKQNIEFVKENDETDAYESSTKEEGVFAKELFQIVNMIIHKPISKEQYDSIFHSFMITGVIPSGKQNRIGKSKKSLDHYYTCKNFDTKSRNCKIYESRPYMCSEFPFYGKQNNMCNYKKCTGCKNGELK